MDKNDGLSSLENVEVLHFLKLHFSDLKIILFLSRTSKNNIFWLYFSKKNKKNKKISIFGQKKPCIIPLGKWPFFLPFKTFVFGLKFILFYTEYQETIFSNIITSKTLLRKRLIFGQKPWTNLLGKDRFFGAQQNGTFLV